MPFKSKQQVKFMFSQKPKIANAWKEGRSSKTGKKEFGKLKGKSYKSLPKKVKKK